ncbi:MAG: glycosyltransferase family 4 protein [Bacteroidales bacterium]|nr:glycosyltransferase family 4 protein [Bacteroidales bacterium]
MKKVVLSVTNDLVTDQRLEKMCNFLVDNGFDVTLVGRRYKNSPPLAQQNYVTERMHLLFKKGFLFYAEYNLRLFFHLLFKQCDLLVANDLDTLLPNYLVSRIRRKKIIYDSHEYFCGLPELIGRPKVAAFWKKIERFCFPKLPTVLTVSQSIADIYNQEYPQRREKVHLVRNFPKRERPQVTETRETLCLPLDKKIIVMQGAINKDRGAEELISAMKHIDNALLLIIGNGDVIPQLKELVILENLEDKVHFIARVSPNKLFNYTSLCDLGCSLEKDTNINYRYCLPNKLFDYIRVGIPSLVSDLPEMKKIIDESQVGETIDSHNPIKIAQAINSLFSDNQRYTAYKQNTKAAAEKYCWENETKVLKEIYGIES